MASIPRLVVAVLWALSVSAVFAGAVSADNIPRPPGAVDNRGWELVSQADVNGNHVGEVSLLSRSGDRVMYDVVGGVSGATSGARPKLVAQRTAAGWVSHNILPPAAEQPGSFYLMAAVNPEVTASIMASFEGGLGTTVSTPDASLVRLSDPGQSVLFHFPVFFGAGGPEVDASSDLSHVYSNVPDPIDPSHQPGTANVYDFVAGPPQLISVMPGTGLAPTCGLPFHQSERGFATSNSFVSEHWVSEDGSVVYFASHGDSAPGCEEPLELYRRDVNAGTTTLVSGPVVAGGTDNGLAAFSQGLADGSAVLYQTQSSLDPTDDADGNSNDMDVYRWTPASGNVCLTCVAPSARVTKVAVSEDGSTVYFSSRFHLSEDAPEGNAPGGTPNLYVLREGVVKWIVRTRPIGSNPSEATQVTPNGDVLIFKSNTAGLNAVSGSDNQGFEQYYRYDYRDGGLACLSCSTEGLAGENVHETMLSVGSTTIPQYARVVTDDGGIVVFLTSTPLVPEDVNQLPDLYEWHDGAVKLISDGVTQAAQEPKLGSVSPEGHDILFETEARLTAQAQGGAQKLYDARIDGGFPPAATSAPGCAGDQCLAPPSASALFEVPSTVAFAGTGNLTPSAAKGSVVKRVSGAARLRKALKACKRKPTSARARCESRARKHFGARRASKPRGSK